MAYDSTLLTAIDVAIASLIAGERLVSITVDDTTMSYGQTSLPDLIDFRNLVAASLRTSTDKPKYVLTSSSKGL